MTDDDTTIFLPSTTTTRRETKSTIRKAAQSSSDSYEAMTVNQQRARSPIRPPQSLHAASAAARRPHQRVGCAPSSRNAFPYETRTAHEERRFARPICQLLMGVVDASTVCCRPSGVRGTVESRQTGVPRTVVQQIIRPTANKQRAAARGRHATATRNINDVQIVDGAALTIGANDDRISTAAVLICGRRVRKTRRSVKRAINEILSLNCG